jgi:3-hydroxybutyryl-CoA dehydrogenase
MRVVKAGKLSPNKPDETLKKITPATDLKSAAQSADLMIEAIIENLPIKQKVFKELDEFAPPHAILATNTSHLALQTLPQRPNAGIRSLACTGSILR